MLTLCNILLIIAIVAIIIDVIIRQRNYVIQKRVSNRINDSITKVYEERDTAINAFEYVHKNYGHWIEFYNTTKK